MKRIYLRSIFIMILGCFAISSSGQVVPKAQQLEVQKEDVSSLKIFPNPASDRFKISDVYTSVKYITINNIIGKQIRKVVAVPDKLYNIEDLKKGVYIIRIFDANDDLVKSLRLSKM